MAWSLVLTDLTGSVVGELGNPLDRLFSWRLSRVATLTFALRLEDPLVDRLAAGDVLALGFEDDVHRYTGEITDLEEDVEAPRRRVVATFQDGAYRLAHRLAFKSTQGENAVFSRQLEHDRGEVIEDTLALLEAEAPVGVGMGLKGSGGSTFLPEWYYKPMLEIVNELGAPLDGYDWEIAPELPTTGRIGTLNLYAAKGQLQPNAKFAYSNAEDDRGNVRSYRRTVSKQGLLNKGYSLPPNFPVGAEPTLGHTDVYPPVVLPPAAGSVRIWQDDESIAKWGLHEDLVGTGDITVEALRLRLLQEHVAIRKQPREVVVFSGPLPEEFTEAAEAGSPIPATPTFRGDYDLGDVVPFRAVVDGDVRVDGLFRVYGVDLALDDAGVATPTLVTQAEG